LEGVEFFLPQLILGTSKYLSHYVGGLANETFALKPPDDLRVEMQVVDGSPHLIGRTTIFGANRFPTYEAVVGKVLDFDFIVQKLAASMPPPSGAVSPPISPLPVFTGRGLG